MNGNDFVAFFLRTPLHVLMGDTMLVTVTGCKTGRKYSTPVNFVRDGDNLWILTSRNRTWWRNVRDGAPVTLLLKGKTLNGFAEPELDPKTVEVRLLNYIRHIPLSARSMGIRVENKVPDAEDVARVARDRLFVKISLTQT